MTEITQSPVVGILLIGVYYLCVYNHAHIVLAIVHGMFMMCGLHIYDTIYFLHCIEYNTIYVYICFSVLYIVWVLHTFTPSVALFCGICSGTGIVVYVYMCSKSTTTLFDRTPEVRVVTPVVHSNPTVVQQKEYSESYNMLSVADYTNNRHLLY